MKNKVLIFTPFYTPSVKGGGPIISIKNIIENLSEKIDFYVLTSDRDLGDQKAFDDIEKDKWIDVGPAKVMYVETKSITPKKLKKIMTSFMFDYYYLNSFFNYKFSILPLLTKKMKSISNGQVIIAPRGEFSPGALALKHTKKNTYIHLFKFLHLQQGVKWHATAESEKNDIQSVFGKGMPINLANNLTANYQDLHYQQHIEKHTGSVKFVFISRISPKKNLLSALEFLKNVSGEVVFSLYGPLEDKSYWEKCEKIIEQLPSSVKVEYGGVLQHDEILGIFQQNHFFLFPTLGENFGHVISESLLGGCPVIISDQTPWRLLEEKEAGWDIALADKNKYKTVIQSCIDMSPQEYDNLSKSAFDYGKKQANKEEDISATSKLFLS